MKRKVFSLLAAMLTAILITSTVFAGQIKLSGSFKLGSLVSTGFFIGPGSTDYVLELYGEGTASTICKNYGSNDVPGQSYPKVNGKATEDLFGKNVQKKGKYEFSLTAKPDIETNPIISWDAGGCPNPNWTAMVDFVYWDTATITVKDRASGEVIDTYHYTCVTTRIPANDGYTFDDGVISCTLVN